MGANFVANKDHIQADLVFAENVEDGKCVFC